MTDNMNNESSKKTVVEKGAYLISTDNYIGVTTSIADLQSLLQKEADNGTIVIIPGYADDLLKRERTMLIMNEAQKAYIEDADKILIPAEHTEMNCIKRKRVSTQKKRSLISFVAGKDDHNVANR